MDILGTEFTPAIALGDTWETLGTIQAGETAIVTEIAACNNTSAAALVSVRYLDASNSNAPVNLATQLSVAANVTAQVLTATKVLSAGDVIQGKVATNVFGVKKTLTQGTTAKACAHDGTTLVIVGAAGRVHTSTDLCETFTLIDLATSSTLTACASRTTGEFVTHDGANFRLSTDSGATWSTKTAASFTCNRILWVAGSINLYVACGSGGGMWTSPDGITWTSRTSGASVSLNDLAFNGTTIIAVGAPAPTNGASCTSTNGTAWTLRDSGFAVTFVGIVWVSGLSAYVAANSTSTTVYSTTDGITYTARATHGVTTAATIMSNGSEAIVLGSSTTFSQYPSLAVGAAYSKTANATSGSGVIGIFAASNYIWLASAAVYTATSFGAAGSMAVDLSASYLERAA